MSYRVILKKAAIFVAFVSYSTSFALAQGVQTGTLRGVVHDAQHLAVAGASVTVASDALQGTRTVVTDSEGGYALRALPPGTYDLTVERAGFATAREAAVVPLGGEIEQDITFAVAGRVLAGGAEAEQGVIEANLRQIGRAHV